MTDENLSGRVERHANAVVRRLAALTEGFTSSDASVPTEQRDAWSPARRLAWQMRFEPEVVASGLIAVGAGA